MTPSARAATALPATATGAASLRRRLLSTACLMLLSIPAAHAGISVLQPPKLLDGKQPFTLTLLFDGDDTASHSYTVPENIIVAASADMMPPQQLQLQRAPEAPAQLTLQPGQFRKITYSASLPAYLRGVVRIETVGIDAAPILVSLVRANDGQAPLAVPGVIDNGTATAAASVITPGADASPIGTAPAMTDLANAARISFNEPMYFAAGNSGGHANAKFQLSFKYRVFQPNDMRSRGLLDNLYFAYTQFSLWDLQSPSVPFRDTNYRPSLYYFLPDLGLRNDLLSRMSIAAGLEHESNGRDGSDSRSLNMFFVRPNFTFGDLNQTQLRITPKLYTYLGPLRDNPDIAQYRGHMDLNITLGKPDGFEFSTTLRKGTRSNYGSADSSLSYPLTRLLPGTAGYLMASVFYGYGESLLTYNQKLTPQFRIGYSLWR
jgi:outer membrane phospholipase A